MGLLKLATAHCGTSVLRLPTSLLEKAGHPAPDERARIVQLGLTRGDRGRHGTGHHHGSAYGLETVNVPAGLPVVADAW
jgi:hypothetical protein